MWKEMEAFDKKIEQMAERVRRAVRPAPASAREMTTVINQEITCVEGNLEDRIATFYNGSGESLVLHRLSTVVYAQPPSQTNGKTYLNRTAFGYMALRGAEVFQFDFMWNYLISSRQSAYSRQPVGSNMFNGVERAQAFDSYEPLILKPADSIEFRLRPLAYLLPGTTGKTANTTYFVNFLAFGYRRPL
jgi:hypothetical protein